MKPQKSLNFYTLILLFCSLTFSQHSFAKNTDLDEKIKVVIHVSHSGKSNYQTALNYAYHIRGKYGDNALIAIISNGAGVGLINSNNSYKNQIRGLMTNNVKFAACNATLTSLKKNNKPIPVVKDVEIVPAGILRVLELQQQGYLYIQP